METKGFTLIELLAVIVILAIIALIATPVILNIIEDTRKSSNQESVNMYGNAVKNAVAKKLLNNPSYEIQEGTYEVSDDDGKCLKYGSDTGCTITVEYDGKIPNIKGTQITINKNGTISFVVKIDGKDYSYPNTNNLNASVAACKVTGYQPYIDEAVCGGEEFFIIANESNSLTMLAKWNITLPQTGYPTQSQTEAGVINFVDNIDLDNSDWGSIDGGLQTAFVYDNTSKLYNYLEKYKEYLKSKHVNVSGVSVPSYKLIKISGVETPSDYDSSLYSKLYLTNYWTGTANSISSLYCVKSKSVVSCQYNNNSEIGVRPLIYIPISETYVEN